MIIWICGEALSWNRIEVTEWNVIGIYLKEEDAKRACKTELHFIGPIEIDTPWYDGWWEGVYYPQTEEGAKC